MEVIKQIERMRGITSNRGRRRIRNRQYFPGYGTGIGGGKLVKTMAHKQLPYRPARRTATSPTKIEISREQGLQALKKQALAIESRLRNLDKWISELEHGFIPSEFRASVNLERCVGCGTCQDVCPTAAISIEEIARVDLKLCTGCGRCVERCPRGALALLPVNRGYKKQVRAAR